MVENQILKSNSLVKRGENKDSGYVITMELPLPKI